MNIMEDIKNRVKEGNKKIALPEASDVRVLEAASTIGKEAFASIVLIGKEKDINELASENKIDISKCEIIEPEKHEKFEEIVSLYYELRKHKGMTMEESKELMKNDYPYFACMLLKLDLVDGVVSGAIHSSSDTFRCALQTIKLKWDKKIVSSFFIMDVPNCNYGEEGLFLYADCGMNQNPNSEDLAEIGKDSAESFELFTGKRPNVAFLSHSTYGSSVCENSSKVQKAVEIAKENYPNINMDGELQFDAAVIKEIGESKAPGSSVAGIANVLIFPDLDSGNIAYKITERLAKAKAYGPIAQGLASPVNDLSRGCSALDIVGVVAITALQSL